MVIFVLLFVSVLVVWKEVFVLCFLLKRIGKRMFLYMWWFFFIS